jgi:hypothetical protein
MAAAPVPPLRRFSLGGQRWRRRGRRDGGGGRGLTASRFPTGRLHVDPQGYSGGCAGVEEAEAGARGVEAAEAGSLRWWWWLRRPRGGGGGR